MNDENTLPPVSQRIKYLIDEQSKGSVRAFCLRMGLKDSQKVNRLFKPDVRNGKYPMPSTEILTLISNTFDINSSWLLNGEGDMLKENSSHIDGNMQVANNTDVSINDTIQTGKLIPFYDNEVAVGNSYSMNMEPTNPVGMIEIGSVLRDSESAIRVYGNSMVPNYPAGCVIGLKLHTDSFIEPGQVYVIETRDNRYLKRVYYTDERTAFHCLSDNHMKYEDGPRKGKLYYQDFEIPFGDVIRLHRVVGVIKRNII